MMRNFNYTRTMPQVLINLHIRHVSDFAAGMKASITSVTVHVTHCIFCSVVYNHLYRRIEIRQSIMICGGQLGALFRYQLFKNLWVFAYSVHWDGDGSVH